MLLVAAGGGGDAITAAALASLQGHPSAVMTYSWDRLLIDPLPGPRSADDFTGLRVLAGHVHQVLPASAPRPPAGSALPRLAADLPVDLLLLDPTGGAVGMAQQITTAATHYRVQSIALVDVGGDVLTHGHEPELRSPLADLLALAGCTLTGLPCDLVVVAPGIDGELDEQTVQDYLRILDAPDHARLDPDTFEPMRQVFTWHPSEATGLLAAATRGVRGVVETRDAGARVNLTDRTPLVYNLDAYRALEHSPAALLHATTSFQEAASLVSEMTGVDEIAYENTKASRRPSGRYTPSTIHQQLASAAARGVDFVTARRLAELVGASDRESLTAFQALLSADTTGRYDPPLYQVREPEDLRPPNGNCRP